VDGAYYNESISVSNCKSSGGAQVLDVGVWVPNPLEETATAYIYCKNFSSGEWVQAAEYTIFQYGKECHVDLALNLGGQGSGTEEFEAIKVTMSEGSTTYEGILEMEVEHSPGTSELAVANKSSRYHSLYEAIGGYSFCNSDSTLCCKLKEDYEAMEGKGEEADALLAECKISQARTLLDDALADLEQMETDAPKCAAALLEIEDAIDTATSEGCYSGAVRMQIDYLKADIQEGEYDLDLSPLNSAMDVSCGGASVAEVDPGEVEFQPPEEDDSPPAAAESTNGDSKPLCPSACASIFILFALFIRSVSQWES
jgi:hypothetical protein